MRLALDELATDPPVSEAQRRAMYAARAGKSTLGIPKSVGEEFVGKDMKPEDWEGLVRGLLKFLSEEAEEPEHQEGVDSQVTLPVEKLIHPVGVKKDKNGNAMDALLIMAFDKASVRRKDADGHLHIELTPISKANVCEYMGSEIPDSEVLGLTPGKMYRLLRDPMELSKGAKTFDGKQLMGVHIPVSADDVQKELTIGSVGTDGVFEAPYLKNSLVVWDGEAIDLIESEEMKELSCGYRYRADMTPGTFEGTPYDGIMRDIIGNHVALVKAGRAGSDVMVMDSKPQHGEVVMSKTVLSRKATYAAGALSFYLQPKLAMDKKFDVTPLLVGVSAKNFADKMQGIEAKIKSDVTPLLAKDADLNDVHALMEHIKGHDVHEGADAEPNSGLPMSKEDMDKKAKDEFEKEKEKKAEDRKRARDEFAAKHKLSAEDMKALDEMYGEAEDGESERAEENEEGKEGGGGEDKKHGMDGKPLVTQTAMDAAIKKASDEATSKALKTANEISRAREDVFPYVGKLAMDATSPNDVYKAALEALGHGEKIKNVDPSAFKTILELQPKPGHDVQLAMDASVPDQSGINKRFGSLFDRISLAG